MRAFVLAFLGLSSAFGAEPHRWVEQTSSFATITGSSDSVIIAEVDAAVRPLGFHRDSTGTTYPGNGVPGIFASYASEGLAKGLVVEGSRKGCIVFSLTNYDRTKEGLASAFQGAVKKRLVVTFGKRAKFFRDSGCANAL